MSAGKELVLCIDELSKIVEDNLGKVNLPNEPRNLYEPIRHILNSGGKRIRPVLVLAACNLFSDRVSESINPALAIEIFHNFTLVHDDIMDNATKRRGIETIHTKWNSNIAILSGDAMSILAYSLLGKCDPKYLSSVLNVFNEVSIGICEGQQLDMDFEKRSDVTIGEYLEMVELKTSILIKGALQIGAILGGANATQINQIGSFGLNLGLAFQLQDDLLDLYGKPETFGKKIGGDIIAGKKSILFLNALGEAENKKELIRLYHDRQIAEEDKINSLIKIFNELQIKKITENQIINYYNKAIKSLDDIDILQERKTVLYQIAKMIMNREK